MFDHFAVRRLRGELQLGWMREVYPGATHTRWSHTLGVMASVIDYLNALVSDPEVPTVRVLISKADIERAIVAAVLHDLAQTAFGHDFEAVTKNIYGQKLFLPRLLADNRSGKSLKELLHDVWDDLDVDRVLRILGCDAPGQPTEILPLDYLIKDIVDGPIDADKFDYLPRDAIACGVPYGASIDRQRFLRALTVYARSAGTTTRVSLAFRAKGATAIESLLLARYQMYGAVYWHHTYRCVQSMFAHIAASALGGSDKQGAADLQGLVYEFVLWGNGDAWSRYTERLLKVFPHLKDRPPLEVSQERALAFLWRVSDKRGRRLVERLAKRDLYKRVFEVRFGDLHPDAEFGRLTGEFEGPGRVNMAQKLEQLLINQIHREIQQRGPTESLAENHARQRLNDLAKPEMPLVVVDMPVRGIPEDRNFPIEIGDAARKYIAAKPSDPGRGRNVFRTIRKMQIENASVRVFAAPELHELVVRYLNPQLVQSCVHGAMPFLSEHA